MKFRQSKKIIQNSYCGNCLPKTICEAEKHEEKINSLVGAFPKEWCFIDKVLVLLMPNVITEDVFQYYCGKGQDLSEMFMEHQIERIDIDLRNLLRKLFDESNEELISRFMLEKKKDEKELLLDGIMQELLNK